VEMPMPSNSLVLADAEVSTRILIDNGLGSASATPLPLVWELASPDHVFEAFAGGTARVGASIRAQDPEAQERIAKAITQSAEQFSENGTIRIPMPAIMFVGTKAA
jgi:hypothetical protein